VDYEVYFNEVIDLRFNKKDMKFYYVESNLVVHDATIKFKIENMVDQVANYEIAMNGFDFYQKPSFTVLFTTNSITDMCLLSKEENTYARMMPGVEQAHQNSQFSFFYFLAIGFGLFMVVVLYLGKKGILYKIYKHCCHQRIPNAG